MRRIGKRKLRVPRDRNGEFSTALFERSQRSEKALVGALASDVRLQGSAFDFGEALHCRRGTLQRLLQNLQKRRASNKVPPTQSVSCKDVFAWIRLNNQDRPSVATTSMRRPSPPIGAGRAVMAPRRMGAGVR